MSCINSNSPQFRNIATKYFSVVQISTHEGCVYEKTCPWDDILMKCFNEETGYWDTDWITRTSLRDLYYYIKLIRFDRESSFRDKTLPAATRNLVDYDAKLKYPSRGAMFR